MNIQKFIKMRCIIFALIFISQVSAADQTIRGERGPLELGEEVSLDLKNVPIAFRIQSFGNMKIRLEVSRQRGTIPEFFIEGPLEREGDYTPIGQGPVYLSSDHSRGSSTVDQSVLLQEAGIYRIVFKPARASAPVHFGLKTTCLEECSPREITLPELMFGLKEQGKLPQFIKGFESELRSLIPNQFIVSGIIRKMHQMANSEMESDLQLDRFPMIPLKYLPELRTIADLFQTPSEDTPDLVVQGKLEDLLGPCDVPREGPVRVSGLPQEFKYGHFSNLALTACQSSHSKTFSQILTSLGAENNSWVEYGQKRFDRPTALIEALLSNGHQIEMRHERTYANFLSFTIHNKLNLRLPVWIDTGLEVQGEPLVIPSGHSQYAWKISGPLVNARFSFFLGISGTAFVGETSIRPHWTGNKVTNTFNSSRDRALILRAVKAAELYLAHNRKEKETVARGRASDGYGYVGICNDSDAVLEMMCSGTYSGYPLVRDHELNAWLSPSDPLTPIFEKLPDDADLSRGDRRNILSRILTMDPHSMDSDDGFDNKLKSQMKAIQLELEKTSE
jgi:hypothetical protein